MEIQCRHKWLRRFTEGVQDAISTDLQGQEEDHGNGVQRIV